MGLANDDSLSAIGAGSACRSPACDPVPVTNLTGQKEDFAGGPTNAPVVTEKALRAFGHPFDPEC
jgi:hypothetical protein